MAGKKFVSTLNELETKYATLFCHSFSVFHAEMTNVNTSDTSTNFHSRFFSLPLSPSPAALVLFSASFDPNEGKLVARRNGVIGIVSEPHTNYAYTLVKDNENNLLF